MSDPYPTPSRKRIRMHVDDDEERAEVKKRHPSGERKISKYEKRFKAEVLKAVRGEESRAHYREKRYVTMFQENIGQAKLFTVCDEGEILEFFTPGHFKDKIEIMYGVKPITVEGHRTRTGEVFDVDLPMRISKSSVRFQFKNNSQRVAHVEMYICYAKDRANDYANLVFQQATTNWIDAPTGADRNIQEGYGPSVPEWSVYDNPKVLMDYKTTMIKMRFDPGEKYTYLMKGPFGNVNLLDKVSPGFAASPTTQLERSYKTGCGCNVFFRYFNEAAIGWDGTQPWLNENTDEQTQISNPPNNNNPSLTKPFTGVQCEIISDYVVRPFEGQTEAEGIRERNMFYYHHYSKPLGASTSWADIDHAAPQSTGVADV